MDPTTHTLAGLAMSRAGLNRLSPRATGILLLAVNAPDIDVSTLLGGPLTYLNCHRHITHALIMIPVIALLPVVVVRLITRKPLAWARACLVSLIGVASHLLLDATNPYGIRLLLPFSAHWFRLDINNLMDVWIWAVLLVAAAWPLLSRLLSSEIGARVAPGRGIAVFALVFFAGFDFARYLLHQRAVTVLESRIYSGAPPERVAAVPGPVNPFRWRGIVEGETFYSIHDVNLLDDFDPTLGRVFNKPTPTPAMEAARRSPVFQDFLRFSQYPLWRLTPLGEPENGVRVEACDLRFGNPPERRFTATAIVDGNLRVVKAWYQFDEPPGSRAR